MPRLVLGAEALLILLIIVGVGLFFLARWVKANRYKQLPIDCVNPNCELDMQWYEDKELNLDSASGKMMYDVYKSWRCADGHVYTRVHIGRTELKETV